MVKEVLIEESNNKKIIERILHQAEISIQTWQTLWSPFLSAPVREEAMNKLILLHDLTCYSDGGYPNAERQRICFTRNREQNIAEKIQPPIKGINIEGNFLFDRATSIDFRNTLKEMGASSHELGDIWIIKDRGAQLLCTEPLSKELNGRTGMVREVQINCNSLEINELRLPFQRIPKTIRTVEASTRLDAIASAGFGISRSKALSHIKEGRLRLNWNPMKQGSKLLAQGDRIQLEGKGSIEILSIEETKRERWKIELLRQ
tara:strand:- start:1571 stop:2353 length:783 start_codon:yes stop_codon:yes gene_type:complete